MKKPNLIIISVFAILSLSFQFLEKRGTHVSQTTDKNRFSPGITFAASGAPGEITCFSCHNGSIQDGSNQNIFSVKKNGNPVSEYIPGETYMVRLELATGNVKEGFQATVLDLTNDDMAGSFSTINTETMVITDNNKNYVSHTTSSNLEGNPCWEWEWNGPHRAPT